MKQWIRELVIDLIKPQFQDYSDKIDECFRSNNTEGMRIWIKQIENTLNIIDGINDK